MITLDRYPGEPYPYDGVTPDSWRRVGKADVHYLSPRMATVARMGQLLHETPHDALYLNSLFCPRFSVLPLILRRCDHIRRRPVLLAPRGMLSENALAIKSVKKRLFLKAARLLRLHEDILWQATSEAEAADIRREFGPRSSIRLAPNLGSPGGQAPCRRRKVAGELRMVFLSRISRMKNLDGALRILAGVKGRVQFHIYGVEDDPDYWRECKALMGALPANIQVEHHGSLPHEAVAGTFAENDLLFLPTLGENYGHVIIEAWQAGCPVLISDRTRWRNLQALGLGWDLPLDDIVGFRAVVEACVSSSESEYRRLSEQAVAHGREVGNPKEAITRNRRVFDELLAQATHDGSSRQGGSVDIIPDHTPKS